MYNRIVLIGRLTADPELRYTPSGVPVAKFRLAVNRQGKNQAGEQEADFVNIVLWRQQAEFSANYLNKGRLVLVEGRLQIRQWSGQDGQRRSTTEVVGNSVQALERRREEAGGAPPAEADLPVDAPGLGEEGVDSTPGPWDSE